MSGFQSIFLCTFHCTFVPGMLGVSELFCISVQFVCGHLLPRRSPGPVKVALATSLAAASSIDGIVALLLSEAFGVSSVRLGVGCLNALLSL